MDRDLPLETHLEELRRRLLACLVPLLLLLVPAYLATPYVLPYLFTPLTKWGYTVYLYQITDGLMLRIRLALLLDLAALSPLILAEALLFAWPGLRAKEKRGIVLTAALAGALFLAGVLLFIRIAAPRLVDLWQGYGTTRDTVISGARYYSIWQAGALVSGLICCLPVLCIPARTLRKALEED